MKPRKLVLRPAIVRVMIVPAEQARVPGTVLLCTMGGAGCFDTRAER